MAATIIEGIYYLYIFLGFYMFFLTFLLYFYNRKTLYSYPLGKAVPVSIVMPCYNEEKTIGKAIDSLLNLDYPKNLLEIIIVDDKSTDGSVDEIKKYVKKYSNVKLIVNKINSGMAAGPTNIGIRAAKYDYIVVADADSTPRRDALKKMIGFLQAEKDVGGVTCSILVENQNKFFEKLQAIEYGIIAFTRKLLDGVDGVYVTPGPFALYRKDVLMKIGLFDEKNITQDIEIVWRMLDKGYKARMCLATETRTIVPKKFGEWWRQRNRWNIGGIQTVIKYKHMILKKGILGLFIIPFFVVSMFLGVLGLLLFFYLLIKNFYLTYLSAFFSYYGGGQIARLVDFNITLSVLNYFGIILFLLGLFFTIFGLHFIKEEKLWKKSIFSFVFYLFVYLMIYPLVLISSIYKFVRGKYKW